MKKGLVTLAASRIPGPLAALFALAAATTFATPAAAQLTTPEEQFGYRIGTDYQLINYQGLTDYWQLLARQSDRMTLESIGRTEEGREQWMATITSPANRPNLERYKEIARRLAQAEGITEEEARALAAEGKAVIWIDGGLHASELLGIQQLMELVWQMVSRDDPETMRFLDEVILLAVHANPDGHALYANWYMQNDDPLERSTRGIPVLYQKYAGHDNNRDFYMASLAESENMNRVMYREWFPQIVYNHHQTGPSGTVMFAPPFRDPPNHNLDPIIITSLDQVGSAMHHRFVVEGKGGTTMRSGAGYSTWWNGGLRTTPYFKNMIGLLTETIGHPTPMAIPFLPNRQITHGDLPLPVTPGTWHFRQSVDYSQTANRAVLDYASRNREHLLFNIWRMGMNSIERGSRDSWTVLPSWIDRVADEVGARGSQEQYEEYLRDPDKRDARGYILPADQHDFPTATRFVNALLKGGVKVHRAVADFSVAGKDYPAGSYVVTAAQAFRPHVIDMFEPQNHPNDFQYPGGPPIAPYDNAGWTLALQMGVEFDRILDGFSGPFEEIDWLADPMAGVVAGIESPVGYVVDHVNAAFTAVNRVLASGGQVFWIEGTLDAEGMSLGPGAFYIPARAVARSQVEEWANELGVTFYGVAAASAGAMFELTNARVGLWDRYGGSMPSGWTRYILEDFEFNFEVIYPPEIDEGSLNDRFDVIILPDGAMGGGRGFRFGGGPGDDFLATLPDSLRARVGSLSDDTSLPALREFIENGGAVIAIGSSTALGPDLGLPLANFMVDDNGRPLGRDDYFTPGSIHDIRVEHVSPITHGLGDRVRVLHSHSPVYRIEDGAANVRRLAWYDSATPLVSGWAWGQQHLEGGTSMIEADIGSGKLFLFGPKITFRSQSHGTFPLLFNGIHYGAAKRPGPVS
ncbi:MAG: peptidase [Gemmatimonadetes bacterium]|nr:peptidase [Gemmatimonadota bacterium]MYB97018.1 peptidase [Gemmatimonadota bacterium]MYI45633.1 peptidase [Gemmatimonadota bacterium]